MKFSGKICVKNVKMCVESPKKQELQPLSRNYSFWRLNSLGLKNGGSLFSRNIIDDQKWCKKTRHLTPPSQSCQN